MIYCVEILSKAEQDCDFLPESIYRRISRAIFRLEQNPRPRGCQKLMGEEGYRLRVGDYRILYRIEDAKRMVWIYRVRHRKEAYR